MVIYLPSFTLYKTLILTPRICILESEMPPKIPRGTGFDFGSVVWCDVGLSSAVQRNTNRTKGEIKKFRTGSEIGSATLLRIMGSILHCKKIVSRKSDYNTYRGWTQIRGLEL